MLARGPGLVVDLCSGKGFSSVLLALERPELAVLMVDSDQRILLDHVDALPNVRFVRADICAPGLGGGARRGARRGGGGVVVGSRRGGAAADAFAAAAACCERAHGRRRFCCRLSRRRAAVVRARRRPPLRPAVAARRRAVRRRARARRAAARAVLPRQALRRDAQGGGAARRDPYDAKVEQLAALIAGVCDAVSCVRDAEMRTAAGTASEGAAAAKNAVLIGRRRVERRLRGVRGGRGLEDQDKRRVQVALAGGSRGARPGEAGARWCGGARAFAWTTARRAQSINAELSNEVDGAPRSLCRRRRPTDGFNASDTAEE